MVRNLLFLGFLAARSLAGPTPKSSVDLKLGKLENFDFYYY
jgi:hypothetical protein